MRFSKIFDAFPSPKFLDVPFAGLSISDSAIRVIKFGKKGKDLFIEKYAEKSVPLGMISSGQIDQKEELIKILSDLKKELSLDYVKVSLPEEKAYIFTAKIPMVSGSEVRSAIESKIEENVPVSPAELVFDYRLKNHKTAEHLDVVVSAIPINVVELYVEVFEKADLALLSLEIESQAIATAIFSPQSLGTALVVHFGLDKVGLYVVSQRIVHFTSTIPAKEDSLENSDFLAQEIKKLYTYWHTLKENVDKPEKKIQEIFLCGENFNESVISSLGSSLGTKVSLANVWTNVFQIDKVLPVITFSDSLKYAVAVGLALPTDYLL